jgi:hypothetical protein
VREFIRQRLSPPPYKDEALYAHTIREWHALLREWRELSKRMPNPNAPPRNDYERDDRESELQIATLDRLIEERKKERDKAAAWSRAFEPGRYPRLHLTGGQRAGRVGADRFRGRYHPHLVIDNTE